MLGYLPLVRMNQWRPISKIFSSKRGRIVRPRPLIGQQFLDGHAVLGVAAEIHCDAVEHFRLDLAVAFQ